MTKVFYLLTVFVLATLIHVQAGKKNKTTAINQNPVETVEEGSDSTVFMIVEKMPEFTNYKGKDFKERIKNYVNDHLKKPKGSDCDGFVYVQFIVEKNGTLSHFKILRGMSHHPECNEAAINALKGMPAWEPGTQHGVKVRVYYTIPVEF